MFLGNLNRILGQIKPSDVVLDVAGWAQPFHRANFVMDALPHETRGFYSKLGLPDHIGDDEEHFTRETWIQLDICSRDPIPFNDKMVDYVICSHVLEDIRDPLWVCSEMIRIAKRGYIETPSRIAESILYPNSRVVGMFHHRWLITIEPNKIVFAMKYHLIQKTGLHLPPHTSGLLKPEQRVQWLHWEDCFGFEEVAIPLGDEELTQRLREFVKGNSFVAPLSYRLLWNTFSSLRNIMLKALVKKIEGIGTAYRHKVIRL